MFVHECIHTSPWVVLYSGQWIEHIIICSRDQRKYVFLGQTIEEDSDVKTETPFEVAVRLTHQLRLVFVHECTHTSPWVVLHGGQWIEHIIICIGE